MKERLQNIYFESLINEICEFKLNSAGQYSLKAALINNERNNERNLFLRGVRTLKNFLMRESKQFPKSVSYNFSRDDHQIKR